jgi:hypothetical protein
MGLFVRRHWATEELVMANEGLFKLEPIVDDPKFEGFGFERDESLRGGFGLMSDFGTDNVKTKGRAWTVPPFAPFWTPQPVVGRVRKFNDYPCVGMLIPAFSRRAVDALRDFLEPNGELLPLVSTVGEYYAYNITTVADILDQERSEFDWIDRRRTLASLSEVIRYECLPERMAGLSIFQLVELPSVTFVSQSFVDRVLQHDLQGFHFVKLWPLPKGVGWRDAERNEQKKKTRVAAEQDVKPVKGNTVVLMLPTAKAKPSKAEKERLAKIMDELDALLYDPTAGPDAADLGSLEGDDVVKGELRLFLSGPDADALVARLHPWLESLSDSWEGGVKVLKRYGGMTDVNCPEEYVDL